MLNIIDIAQVIETRVELSSHQELIRPFRSIADGIYNVVSFIPPNWSDYCSISSLCEASYGSRRELLTDSYRTDHLVICSHLTAEFYVFWELATYLVNDQETDLSFSIKTVEELYLSPPTLANISVLQDAFLSIDSFERFSPNMRAFYKSSEGVICTVQSVFDAHADFLFNSEHTHLLRPNANNKIESGWIPNMSFKSAVETLYKNTINEGKNSFGKDQAKGLIDKNYNFDWTEFFNKSYGKL